MSRHEALTVQSREQNRHCGFGGNAGFVYSSGFAAFAHLAPKAHHLIESVERQHRARRRAQGVVDAPKPLRPFIWSCHAIYPFPGARRVKTGRFPLAAMCQAQRVLPSSSHLAKP
jgi:hypothetical protein